MRDKIVSAEDAIALVRDGDTICTSGFVGIGTPDALLAALERRFLDGGTPSGLTLVFAAGQGDGKQRGLNRVAHAGLLRRVIGGHWGLVPRLGELALSDAIEAYNLPQGCISHLYRDIAAGKPGVLTRIGLDTFVDPRRGGGKVNASAQEDLVKLVEIEGQEWLLYKAFPIHIAFLRGTTADPDGNVTMEREALTLDARAMAAAARNSNGLVIVQVERLAARGSLPPRQVQIPGVLVDCVVVSPPGEHTQTYATWYSPVLSAELRAPLDRVPPVPLDVRKLIARRAAFEIAPNAVCNLGVGMPEAVAQVAREERLLELVTLTTESGAIGGVPANGLDFGAAVNVDAVVEQNQQFDFYDGGGLDVAFLGMAECDAHGNVNVSRFGKRLAGAGGFINISQSARSVVFVGTFTADGLEVESGDGKLSIVREGQTRKFVAEVGQVTFSGARSQKLRQSVLYVTERCVLRRRPDGVELIEIAPGIDLERDVLRHMGFRPLMRDVKTMDPRIFKTALMELRGHLFPVDLESRISYDAERNLLFNNFEGLRVRSVRDIELIQRAVERRCRPLKRSVRVIVNYDAFDIDEALADGYAAMVRRLSDSYYSRVSRYTTSAFLRAKLGDAFSRHAVAPHLFETEAEARRFHEA